MNRVNPIQSFAARLREHISCVADSQSAAGTRRDLPFNSLALALFGIQFEQNSAYRTLCQSREIVPGGIKDWSQIPSVPAAAFKEWELSCILSGERTEVFFSSGTTTHQPSRHYHHRDSLALYEESLMAWFGVHFLEATPGSTATNAGSPPAPHRALALTPPRGEAPNSSLVHMFDTLRRRLKFGDFRFTGHLTPDRSWALDCLATVEALGAAALAREPLLVLGTAFSYVHLLDYMAENELQVRLPVGSQVLETGGYKGRSRSLEKPKLHSLITQRLGVPGSQIICEYGMSELSSQAYDRPCRLDRLNGQNSTSDSRHPTPVARCFRFPPWVRARIVSPETGEDVSEGEPGLIRVFDLANVYSVMAIQTEDLAVRKDGGFELLGRATMVEPRGCSLMLG